MSFKKCKATSFPAVALAVSCALWLAQALGDDRAPRVQRTFASATEATNALIKAAKAHDRGAIHEMFGPEVTNLWTGDPVLDQKNFEAFAADVSERCQAVPQGADKVTLEIGRNSWPFPIPLTRTNGVWLFDTLAGQEEIINRHIGRDEYYAIGVCRAYVRAQQQYSILFASGETPLYAQRLRSRAGKKDSLYWAPGAGGPPSPLSEFIADACLERYNWGKGTRSFHGYFFKILTQQGDAASGGKLNYIHQGKMTGGFALVAYPVRWGESGIMTFIVNQDGAVYQRSLGEETARIASAMKDYNPDSQWSVVHEQGITTLTPPAARESALEESEPRLRITRSF
jgi:hypothetical protein